jgi:hypothetical protein
MRLETMLDSRHTPSTKTCAPQAEVRRSFASLSSPRGISRSDIDLFFSFSLEREHHTSSLTFLFSSTTSYQQSGQRIIAMPPKQLGTICIMADDHASKAISYHKAGISSTPNIDRSGSDHWEILM